MLNEDDTEKLLEICDYSDREPYQIVVQAIDVMYKAMIQDDEE